MVQQGYSGRWERPYGEGRSCSLPEKLGEEMTTSLQFLGTNLQFLALACGRLIRILESHRACRVHFPPEVAGRLNSLEVMLDLEYLEAETPKALGESLEGLNRLAGAVRELETSPGPGNGRSHGC
jgi:hypothetical protein